MHGERPADLARRLARAKAWAVAKANPNAVVIGSDQVADLDGTCLGKPGHHEAAVAMLRTMSGKVVHFHTAMAVVCDATGQCLEDVARIEVKFRTLRNEEIETYLRIEQPYDCAGSAKSEGLGISLLEHIRSDDPTALIGLPLIRTASMLRQFGIDPLRAPCA
jgi:septum formation protein